MTVTKSIRLDETELRQVEKLIDFMPGASEAAALKHNAPAWDATAKDRRRRPVVHA